MMGVGHALSGFCAGLAVGDALLLPPAVIVVIAVAGAGAALLCDIDCAGSTAESAFGPLSTLAHYGCIELHYMVVSVVDPHNNDPHGAHRGLTHWWPWWITTGGAVAIGCELSKWTAVGVLIVLFTLAVRGLSIPGKPSTPQRRFTARPYTHDKAMEAAYVLMKITPLAFLRWARKHTNRKDTIGKGWFSVVIPVGKISVFVTVSALVFGADYYGKLPQLGPWLGFLVWAGQFLHWIGDSPTEMGVPGFYLTRFWRLPKWIAFKAGGPFEVIVLWIPMGLLLAPFLIMGMLGAVPHELVVTVLYWIAAGFGVLALIIAIATTITHAMERRYA